MRNAGDAHINDRGTGFHPIGLHHLGAPHRRDQNIRAATHRSQILGARMGNGHRAIFAQQQLPHRLTKEVGATDHHRLHPRHIPQLIPQQHQTAQGRTRHQTLFATGQQTCVHDAQPIHVFGGINARHDGAFVQMIGHRKLAQNAMDRRVRIQFINQRKEHFFRHIRRQAMFKGRHANLDRLLVLGRDINLACRVFAHQNDGKAGCDAVILFQTGHMVRHLAPYIGSKSLAIYRRRGHARLLLVIG
mmetsp:Transcript_29432/g.57612  ORF Transcript_29432/g.57612 Transcript_29432/m.57612 type:complete len:246 (-) Transcript_29432:3491-4228(-)